MERGNPRGVSRGMPGFKCEHCFEPCKDGAFLCSQCRLLSCRDCHFGAGLCYGCAGKESPKDKVERLEALVAYLEEK